MGLSGEKTKEKALVEAEAFAAKPALVKERFQACLKALEAGDEEDEEKKKAKEERQEKKVEEVVVEDSTSGDEESE